MHSNSFSVGRGGKGANQAVACARLSRSQKDLQDCSAIIQMRGTVGDDAHGQKMITSLQEYGIDTSGVRIASDSNTGVAVIIVEEQTGHNRIMPSMEANKLTTPQSLQSLGSPLPSLIVLQLEIPFETVLHILDLAQQKQVPVLLNPAPAIDLPEEAYPKITHLVLNESEAALPSGMPVGALADLTMIAKVVESLKAKGTTHVILTMGSNGVYYSGPGGQSGHVPAEKVVSVVDSTAAGDTFVGAYALAAVKEDFTLKNAVETANRAAAKTVQRKGVQESIPWLDEL